VHFGLPGAQPVDVAITVAGGGLRGTGVIEDVDPADYRGRVLTVRIGADGSLAR
jgi:hypothetical protein